MKITKGMTIEQFIDYLENEKPFAWPLNEDGLINIDHQRAERSNNYCAVADYNNRLKDTLTEGMIVNPFAEPEGYNRRWDDISYMSDPDWIAWQEAEDKVILKGWYKINNCFANGNYKCAFGWLEDMVNGGIKTEINTLGDLFRATNGELETKNFNI